MEVVWVQITAQDVRCLTTRQEERKEVQPLAV